jgi:hypothetical protein
MKVKITKTILNKALPRIFNVSDKRVISIVITEKEESKTIFV